MPIAGESAELPDTWRANYISYIYGDCTPLPPEGEKLVDGGCAPPLEVQVWPACERNASLFGGNGPPAQQRRGVESLVIERGHDGQAIGVELYSDDSAIVIFGTKASLVDRAVENVQPVAAGYVPADGAPELVALDDLPRAESSSSLGDSRRCTP